MKNSKFTEKMLKDLNLDDWRKENQSINEEFGIQKQVLSKPVTLEIIEALVHDAIAYKMNCIMEELHEA